MSQIPMPDRIGARSVLFVMAAAPEYGPALRKRITPLMCGVGPVEAAVTTAAALAELAARGALPDLVVSLGSAGSAVLEQAAIYQVSHVSYRDIDASPLGFAPGTTPFLDLPATVALTHRIPGVPEATLSTGADIVTGAGYARIEADMVDMETFAVMRAADRFALPLIGLRGISDGAQEVAGFENWTEYLEVIDARLAETVDALRARTA